MNPMQASAEAPPTSTSERDLGGSNRIRLFTGNYYRVLGWVALATMVISVATAYWTDSLYLDFSFVLWFFMGTCLKEGRPAARKWAIAIFYVVTAFVIIGYIIPQVSANFGAFEFERPHPAFFVISGLMWLIFALPAILLLSSRGRAEFTQIERGEHGAGDKAPAAVE